MADLIILTETTSMVIPREFAAPSDTVPMLRRARPRARPKLDVKSAANAEVSKRTRPGQTRDLIASGRPFSTAAATDRAKKRPR